MSDSRGTFAARARAPLAAALCATLPLLAACASKGGPAPNSEVVGAQQSTRVATGITGASTMTVARTNAEDYVRSSSLAAPADRAWPAVAAAYDDLKLPVTLRVDAQRQIASQGKRFRGSLGGTRLGLLFNCGASSAGGDAADSYELTIDVATTVRPGADASQTSVQTIASALAKPVMTSGEPVRCVSTGRLEEKLVQAATKRLAP
jgi:hypothetical protein